MADHTDEAFTVAFRKAGADLWERMSDLERTRAVREQVIRQHIDRAKRMIRRGLGQVTRGRARHPTVH